MHQKNTDPTPNRSPETGHPKPNHRGWPRGHLRPRTNRPAGVSEPAKLATPKTALFVYLLVGVHDSHQEAKAAFRKLPLAITPPVWFERNANGLGKCKTWLAVSPPYANQRAALLACRQLAAFQADGAVCVRRGDR